MAESPISDRIISVLISEFADPFSIEFDLEKIVLEIGDNVSEHEEMVLKFIAICNENYLEINEHFNLVFSELNLTRYELIELLFKAINKNSLDLAPHVLKQLSNKNAVAIHLEDLKFSKFLFENGQEVSIQHVLEVGGDILSLLLSATNSWEFNIKNIFPRPMYTEEELGKKFSYLWYPSNMLLSMQTAYRILIYENGKIENNEDFESLKISTGNKWLGILRQASEIRSENKLREYFFPFLELQKNMNLKKIGIGNYEIINGQVTLTSCLRKGSDNRAIASANLMSKYDHYSTEKLKYYDNLTLTEINEILIQIVDFVDFIYKQSINKGSTSLIYNTPSKINKDHLINHIETCTKYTKNVIDKVLSSLTSTDKYPSLWRNPFYKIGNNLLFSIATLNAPNYSILYESILKHAGYSDKYSELLLLKLIESELDNESIQFKFTKIDLEKLQLGYKNFENNLLYELNDYFIFIQAICYSHPFESDEMNEVLKNVGESASQISDKLEFLSKKITKKPILPLIVSNYNTFSSLSINGITIIDLNLLTNYFIAGCFRRGQISFKKEIRVQKEIAKIDYYKGEKEFNNNFLNFITNPIPISTINERLGWREAVITPPGISPKITIDLIDQISDDDSILNRLKVLENALNNKYYYDHDSRTKELYDKSISYSLTNILHLIAFGDYELSKAKIDLYFLLEKFRIEGFSHILMSLNDAIGSISYSKIKREKKFKVKKLNDEKKTLELYSNIFDKNSRSSIRLKGFEINSGVFSKNEEKELISLALSILSTLGPYNIDDDRLEDYFLQLAIIKGFKTKYQLDFEFYTSCDNFMDTLNFNNKYQRARNFGEEILTIAIDEHKHHYGWGILFRCFTHQNNVFEACIYGALYYTSLSIFDAFKYSVIVELLYNGLKFFRNFKLYDMLESINQVINQIKLEKYDEQKFKLSYYLGSLYLIKSKPEIFNESLQYLTENFNDIVSFHEHGILPWLNYLYNIKRNKDAGFKEFDRPIEEQIEKLESLIDSDVLDKIKSNHFGDKNNVKKKLVKSLVGVFETNSVNDFKFEVGHLAIQSDILLSESIKDNDFDSILLAGIVINDNSLTYDNKYYPLNTLVRVTPEVDKKLENKLNNYKNYIIDNIMIEEGQLFVWLFNIHEQVFVLAIDSKKIIKLKELKEWDYEKMREWIKRKESFYFDSSNYFDLTEQEVKYLEILKSLSFSNLGIEDHFDEILFTSSIELAEFPTNLIVNNNELLGSQTSISNVISAEWYIQKGLKILLNNNFNSTAWIPIDDGDVPINLSFNRFKPILEKNKVKIITSRNILSQIETDVNIFLAHGELGFKSFKGIYTNHDSESAILYPKELFGKGEIAILFICNSGVSNEDFFANGITSLCYDILGLGYKAVIAPFWRLDTTIPSYWYNEFICAFKSGFKLSEAVYLANLSLADYKKEISNSFLAPEGKLAMHIYGNPNIRIKL